MMDASKLERGGGILIGQSWLESKGASKDFINWFLAFNRVESVIDGLRHDKLYEWANMLLVWLMSREKRIKYAIRCTELVASSLNGVFDSGSDPRFAIEAAKKVLLEDTKETRKIAGQARDRADHCLKLDLTERHRQAVLACSYTAEAATSQEIDYPWNVTAFVNSGFKINPEDFRDGAKKAAYHAAEALTYKQFSLGDLKFPWYVKDKKAHYFKVGDQGGWEKIISIGQGILAGREYEISLPIWKEYEKDKEKCVGVFYPRRRK
jgi:hypothetical protein